MKVLSAPPLVTEITAPLAGNNFKLPQGLIGFSDYTTGELLYMPEHLPFLWLKLSRATDSVHFVVIEPGGLIPDYTPELFDADAEVLDLRDASEAMLLNIVTLRHQNPLEATVNLVGPIVMNRRTRSARQLVIANYSQYGAHWPLVDNSSASKRASA
jgi:flagellar assembly factor FliW